MARFTGFGFLILLAACGEGDSTSGGPAGAAPGPALPLGWSSRDLGGPAVAGHASGTGASFEVCGAGADIWNSKDEFHFVSQPLSGDGQVTVRVQSLTDTDAWAKAGVMMRDGLAADARFAMMVVTPANGTSFQWRGSPGGGASHQPGPAWSAPAWVRLTRTGSTFRGEASPDGSSWTHVGSVDLPLGGVVEAGLCVTSHNPAVLACAEFTSLSVDAAPPPPGTLRVDLPASRTVFQRDSSGLGRIRVSGGCPAGTSRVEGRLVALQGGTSSAWTVIDTAPSTSFSGSLSAPGGWYRLELASYQGSTATAYGGVDKVGAGEVFVVVGHSVAHGDSQSIPGAADDRVNAVHFDGAWPSHQAYNDTADPGNLPVPGFVQYGTGIQPAPFGYNAYIWSRFGEILAQRLNVPVLVYNAAFGGTSLEHWAKSSQGIPFDHSFVKSSIRMPYINLYNSLKTYIPRTGIRALLSDHGQNDWPSTDENAVVANYLTWIGQARTDLGHGSLAVVVNRQTPFGVTLIRRVQDRVAASPSCFAGPDYDTLAPEDRYDGIHLALSGQAKAAQMWADALGDGFFAGSQPWIP